MRKIISFLNAFNDIDFSLMKKKKKYIEGIIVVLCLLFSINLKTYLQSYDNITVIILYCMFISILEVLLFILSCLSFPMLISAISYCRDSIKNLVFVIEYLLFFYGSLRILVFLLFKI